MAGEVTLSSTLNNTTLQTLPTTQLVYVLINAQPVGAGVATQMPLNFGLVLDRSGSMAGSNIQNLRAAVKQIIGRMSQPKSRTKWNVSQIGVGQRCLEAFAKGWNRFELAQRQSATAT